MQYHVYLKDQQKIAAERGKSIKRKAVKDKILAVESKIKLLKESRECLSKEADKLAVQAEEKHDFTSIAKSNAFRQKVLENEKNEEELVKK